MLHRPATTRAGRAALVAASTALLLGAAACGDDPAGAGSAPAPSSSPGNAASSPPATTDPGTTPSASSEPGAATATGPLLQLEGSRVNVPAGWIPSDSALTQQASASLRAEGSLILADTVSLFPKDLDELVAIARPSLGYRPRVTVVDPVEIDGVLWAHLTGVYENFGEVDYYTVEHRGRRFSLTFEQPEKLPQAQRDAVVASVLASFRFTV